MLKKKTYKLPFVPHNSDINLKLTKTHETVWPIFYHFLSFDLIMRFQLSRKSDNNGKDLIAV